MTYNGMVREFLADGEWHTVPELYMGVAVKVPPERASRCDNFHMQKMGVDERVTYGRRRLMDLCITVLKQRGEIEVEGRGTQKRFRIIRSNDAQVSSGR